MLSRCAGKNEPRLRWPTATSIARHGFGGVAPTAKFQRLRACPRLVQVPARAAIPASSLHRRI
jgi:hypothetical protein